MENNIESKNIKSKNRLDIKGWGIDADKENDPAYPMKIRTEEDIEGYNWDRPALQTEDVEILKSIERSNLTAVFGTSTPPSGLSGMIRRYAFKHSESSYAHWLPLVLADRINMVEGIVDDLKRGHIPNIFAERGWTAEMKYNKKDFTQKMVVGAVLASVAVTFLVLMNKSKKS